MDAWLLYIFLVALPNLTSAVKVSILVCGVLLAGLIIGYFVSLGDDTPEIHTKVKKFLKIAASSFAVFFIIIVLSPSRSQIVYLIGGYYVTNIEEIGDIPPNLVRAANKFLEDFSVEQPETTAD